MIDSIFMIHYTSTIPMKHRFIKSFCHITLMLSQSDPINKATGIAHDITNSHFLSQYFWLNLPWAVFLFLLLKSQFQKFLHFLFPSRRPVYCCCKNADFLFFTLKWKVVLTENKQIDHITTKCFFLRSFEGINSKVNWNYVL